jgi:hypothetical protein
VDVQWGSGVPFISGGLQYQNETNGISGLRLVSTTWDGTGPIGSLTVRLSTTSNPNLSSLSVVYEKPLWYNQYYGVRFTNAGPTYVVNMGSGIGVIRYVPQDAIAIYL